MIEGGAPAISPKRLAWLTPARLCIAVLLAAAAVYARYQIFDQPIRGDRAFYEYVAQVIARGGVPYRDVVDVKSPLAPIIGAIAITAGHHGGVRDVFAVRSTFVACGVLTTGLVFLTTMAWCGSRARAVLAAMIFLVFDPFIVANTAGVEPKTPMIMFGLASLLCVARDRPFAAGTFSMLSALSWQPGLLFFGAAGLSFSRYLTSWNHRKIAALVVGALWPLTLMLIYLWSVGALRDFYIWTIAFNLYVKAQEPFSLRRFEGYLLGMRTAYGPASSLALAAAVGALLWIGQEIRTGIQHGYAFVRERAPLHAGAIAGAVYFAFCAIDSQGVPDTFPLLPFIASFSSVTLMAIVPAVLRRVLALRGAVPSRGTLEIITATVLSFMAIGWIATNTAVHRLGAFTLTEQTANAGAIAELLEPGDRIFMHGIADILVLAHLSNASPHLFLDRGTTSYLDTIEHGGFDGWFSRLRAQRPKIVVLARMHNVARRQDILDWLAKDYVLREGPILPYYIRVSGS